MYCLRNISERDCTSLAKMHEACFSDVWNSNYFRSFITNMQCFGFIISDERKTLSDEISLAKTEKNAAPHECINNEWLDCGFVLCHRISPEEADLLKICVLPAYRRRGIGKILLEEAKKYAKNNGIKKILLEVAVNNPSAIYFYERFGFQKIAQRKGYYKINQTTVDANVMANESFI